MQKNQQYLVTARERVKDNTWVSGLGNRIFFSPEMKKTGGGGMSCKLVNSVSVHWIGEFCGIAVWCQCVMGSVIYYGQELGWEIWAKIIKMTRAKSKLTVERQASSALYLAHVRWRCKFRGINEWIKKWSHGFFGIKELQGPSSLSDYQWVVRILKLKKRDVSNDTSWVQKGRLYEFMSSSLSALLLLEWRWKRELNEEEHVGETGLARATSVSSPPGGDKWSHFPWPSHLRLPPRQPFEFSWIGYHLGVQIPPPFLR